MDALGIIRDLLAHMEWADATVWQSVRRLGQPDEKLIDRLRHLHATQHAFLMIWRGQPLDFDHIPPDIEQWARDYYAGLAEFLQKIDAASIDRVLEMPWAGRYVERQPSPTILGETMIQVASHSNYHRGQVNTRIREAGGQPPNVDYIMWLWLGKPAAAW